MCILSVSGDIAAGIIGYIIGLLSPLVILLYTYCMSYVRYNRYEGNYISYLKNIPDKAHYHLNLTRKGNKFIIIGRSLLSSQDQIQGEIEMSTSLINHGRGFYYHDIAGQKRKFGFYEIQLTADDILVHQDIKNLKKDNNGNTIEIGEDCSAAYVWVKQ